MRFLLLAVIGAAIVPAATIPRGAEFQIRLTSPVSSATSRVHDPVEAVVTAPVLVEGVPAVSLGTKISGEVAAVKQAANEQERAQMRLVFNKLSSDGKSVSIKGRVVDVDNARESVDDDGTIQGILASETISARIDQGISKVGARSAGFANVLEIAKGAILKDPEGTIAYTPGTDMTFRVLEPFAWNVAASLPALQPVSDENELYDIVNAQPFQTVAENPPKPSDMTNLMFVGSEDSVRRTFEAAEWTTAQALNQESALETFRAIAELRGYKEAPMSILLLGGRAPDLVFQKSLNTFAKRHHLRVWRMTDTWHDRPIWVASSTHDTGIEFSQENHTFIHRIDPRIDRERAKVVSDLLYTGKVKSLALVERPKVPTRSQNATGDDLITDGHMAVLMLE